jgi:hypothetical protein
MYRESHAFSLRSPTSRGLMISPSEHEPRVLMRRGWLDDDEAAIDVVHIDVAIIHHAKVEGLGGPVCLTIPGISA